MFEALRESGYRWLWAATVGHNAAFFAVVMITTWTAYHQMGAALASGLVIFLTITPGMIVTPLAGAVADATDRRRVIRAGAWLGCVSCTVVAGLAQLGWLQLPALLGLALAVGVARAIEHPGRIALVGNVAAPGLMLNAFSLLSMASHGAQLVGPMIGTFLLSRSGPVAALTLCAGLYALAALATYRLRVESVQRVSHPAGWVVDIRRGIAYVRQDRPLSMLTAFVVGHCMLTMSYMGVLPKVLSVIPGFDSAAFGLVVSSIGLGAVIGTLLLAGHARRAEEERLLISTGLLSGLSLVALAVSASLPLAVVTAALVGCSQTLFMVLIHKAMQARAAEEVRGRVASFASFLISASMGGFSLVLGAVADRIDPVGLLVASALVFVGMTVVYRLRVPEFKGSIPAGPGTRSPRPPARAARPSP